MTQIPIILLILYSGIICYRLEATVIISLLDLFLISECYRCFKMSSSHKLTSQYFNKQTYTK